MSYHTSASPVLLDGAQISYSERFTTFLLWGGLVGLAFFSVYPTMNWLTGLRSHQYGLFIEQELNVPFVPEFIWLYLSMYILFILPPFFLSSGNLKRLAKELILATYLAGAVFLIFPARLGFPRILPTDSFYHALFQGLFAIDQPFNLVPSLHVVYSTAIILAISTQANITFRSLLFTWLALIMASTILVHQHHLLDVFVGLVLALLIRFYWKEKHA